MTKYERPIKEQNNAIYRKKDHIAKLNAKQKLELNRTRVLSGDKLKNAIEAYLAENPEAERLSRDQLRYRVDYVYRKIKIKKNAERTAQLHKFGNRNSVNEINKLQKKITALNKNNLSLKKLIASKNEQIASKDEQIASKDEQIKLLKLKIVQNHVSNINLNNINMNSIGKLF